MYERANYTREEQRTYELIETVQRPEIILTLPQGFLHSNRRITFHDHTGGFGVNFHLQHLLTNGLQYSIYTVEKITSIFIISMAAQQKCSVSSIPSFIGHKGFELSLKLYLNL